ncbi:hypothetical protein ACHHYP_09621 [Achlya hypogyna]|uniref:Protein kinase domain-containing protein n=1 Tax=Achlya hypogyna TaxID=1202772 RepID=A0A1V9YMU2_ACHHY|nr:hypothetical protein ACHHYP_09621 [Achlya hypogyna]
MIVWRRLLNIGALVSVVNAGATLLATCPEAKAGAACVISGNYTVVVPIIGATLNASGLRISDATSLPTDAFEVNLSNNKMGSLANLQHLTALRTLDLSNNHISSVSFARSFSNLTFLSLRNNFLTALVNPEFPPSLTSLDLSGNPITIFDVTQATYLQLSALSTLVLGSTALPLTGYCYGTRRFLNRTTVCVTDVVDNGASGVPEGTLLSKLLLILGGFCFLAVFYMYLLKRLFSGVRPRSGSAATCASSAYSGIEDEPTEYCVPLSMGNDMGVIGEPLLAPDVAAFKLDTCSIKKLRLQATVDGQIVYLGSHRHTKVSVKVAAPTHAHDTRAVAASVREVVALARLQHSAVVGLVGFVASPLLLDLTVVLEYTPHGSLARLLERAPPCAATKRRLAADVVNAIAYLHALVPPIVHNAVTPAHVLVTADGRAKLSGFIYSHAVGEAPAVVAEEAAPEVTAAVPATPASDIYLCGRLLETLGVGTPVVVARCLQLDPTQRPRAADLAALLEA